LAQLNGVGLRLLPAWWCSFLWHCCNKFELEAGLEQNREEYELADALIFSRVALCVVKALPLRSIARIYGSPFISAQA
jgi:hypothetical protein